MIKFFAVVRDLAKVFVLFIVSYALEWLALGIHIILFGETSFAHVILIEIPFFGVLLAFLVLLAVIYALESEQLKECETARGS